MEIYRGDRLKIEKNLVQLPGGARKERIVVRPGRAVAVLPVEGEWCVLIRQWRHAIDEYILEAPAGTMDPGESPLDTARRELIEETGMRAETFLPRGFIYTTPGYTDEKIYLFEATDLSPSSDFEKDDDEIIEVVKVRLKDAWAMIADGRIVDAKTIGVLARCLRVE